MFHFLLLVLPLVQIGETVSFTSNPYGQFGTMPKHLPVEENEAE